MAGMRHYKRLLAIGGTAAVLLSNMASASLLAYANEQSVEYAEVEASAAAAEADSGQTGPYQGEGQSEPDVQDEAAVYLDEEPEIAVYSEDDAHEVSADDAASGDDSPEIEENALEADEEGAVSSEDAETTLSDTATREIAGTEGAYENTEDRDAAEPASSDENAEDADEANADKSNDDAASANASNASKSNVDAAGADAAHAGKSNDDAAGADAANAGKSVTDAASADAVNADKANADQADADEADAETAASDERAETVENATEDTEAEDVEERAEDDKLLTDDEITDEELTDDLAAEDVETLEDDALLTEEETEELKESGEEGDPVSYDAEVDGITVRVEAPCDAFSEDVSLVVSRIEDERDLTEVADTLDASDVTYDGYLALDIHFENENGTEIEPDGEVRVAFDLAEDVLPEEADAQTLAVQHFDTSSGDVEVVTVADTTDDASTGEVTVSGNTETLASSSETAIAVAAEFDVASFSTFTITWTYSGRWSNESKTLSIMCVDENGSELPATVAPGPISISSGTAVELTSNNDDLALDGYSLVGVSAYVNNTYYDDVTSVKASYSNWGWGSWTYRLYSGTAEVYSGSTAPSLTLTYGTGEIRISYTLDASDAGGDVPESQVAEEGSYIVLPECTATRDGYTFLGWTEKEFKIVGDNSDYQTIYQPGDSYKVTGSQTFHAAWSKNGAVRSDFYVILNGTIPAIDDGSGAYTNGIQIDGNVNLKKWIYDTDGTELVETADRDYKKNSVSENQYTLPTNAQLMEKINAKYDSIVIDYHVALSDQGKLYVDSIRSRATNVPFDIGEELYVLWYAQKYQSTVGSSSYTWHIDGTLQAKDKATITYVDNAGVKGTVSGMPIGYQVTKGTTVPAGSSGSQSGNVKEPSLQNYVFLGWNTKADGSGTFYNSNDSITINGDVNLYAMWKDPTADIVDTGVDLGNAGHVTMMLLAMGVMTAAGLGLIARRKLF